ncbi:MAG: hypothetical protein P4L71_14975 [Acetobacteraceae bacterium]|nr:hypothetical protein [Acetobacteraceae bacterium]
MNLPQAVIVHGRADADAALAAGRPITLLSAPGAAGYAGCLWWQVLATQARAAHPELAVVDLLDCGPLSGCALAALRIGLRGLVLTPEAPGRDRVAAIAAAEGALLLAEAPDALDLAAPGAARRLHDWLQARPVVGDTRGGLG